MNVHVLQHVSFEGPGMITRELQERGHLVTLHHVWDGAPIPRADDIDMLVSMGGPMSVHDTAKFSWIAGEQQLIRELADAHKPILGICLGAQQMSSALGGEVVPAPVREIGWFPITWDRVPWQKDDLTVLHWHGEMISLPAGAHPIGRSDACPIQGFWKEPSLIGLQFHLEADAATLAAMIAGNRDELTANRDSEWVNDADDLREALPRHQPSTAEMLHRILDWMMR